MSVADAEALVPAATWGDWIDRPVTLPPDRAKLGAVDRRLVVGDCGDLRRPHRQLPVADLVDTDRVHAALRAVEPSRYHWLVAGTNCRVSLQPQRAVIGRASVTFVALQAGADLFA